MLVFFGEGEDFFYIIRNIDLEFSFILVSVSGYLSNTGLI